MQIKKTPIREDHKRDTYWTRINMVSDDGHRRSIVLACVSHEFLWDTLKTNKFEISDVERVWLPEVVKLWSSRGDAVFLEPVHYHVNAMTDEGVKNGMEFLQKDITP